MTGFGERLRAAREQHGPLCVGIDPHAALLREWGLDDSAAGARDFGLRVVEAAAGRVAIVKPQVSFFERFGSAGFAALEEVLAAARAVDLLTLADAKRGDIGSTMDAYAQAWLTPGAPLEADAMTANPYLGLGTLAGTFAIARTHGKGVFVLSATSNDDAIDIQGARLSDETVSAVVARGVRELNVHDTDAGRWGSIGIVVGGTVDLERAGLAHALPAGAPILGPGFGVQGARPEDLLRFGAAAPQVIASESRSILVAGPEGLVAAIDARRADYAEVLRG